MRCWLCLPWKHSRLDVMHINWAWRLYGMRFGCGVETWAVSLELFVAANQENHEKFRECISVLRTFTSLWSLEKFFNLQALESGAQHNFLQAKFALFCSWGWLFDCCVSSSVSLLNFLSSLLMRSHQSDLLASNAIDWKFCWLQNPIKRSMDSTPRLEHDSGWENFFPSKLHHQASIDLKSLSWASLLAWLQLTAISSFGDDVFKADEAITSVYIPPAST